jgi:Flp pilus assembly protein TadG
MRQRKNVELGLRSPPAREIEMRCRASGGRRKRRGAAAVELALLLPLLCFLFVIAVDYARIFYFSMTVTNCARSGGIYGSQNPNTANDQSGIVAACNMDAGNLDAQQMTVTSSTDSATSPTYVIVTVTYPFSTITNFPGITYTTDISRTIRVTVTPLTPG